MVVGAEAELAIDATLGASRASSVCVVNVDQIDEAIQRLTNAEHRIAANLHDLELNSTWQVLSTDTLHGVTGQRLNSAIAARPGLWELFTVFQDALASIRAARGTGRVSPAERQATARLLTDRTILLSESLIPLGQRGLLDDPNAQHRVSIEELLRSMRDRYEVLRTGVAEVAEINRRVLPMLDASERTLDGAEQQARTLGLNVPEVATMQRMLASIRLLATTDPLSISQRRADEFERGVHDAASAVGRLQRSRDELEVDVAKSVDLVAELRDLRTRAESARVDALQLIARPMGLKRVPAATSIDGPSGIAPRLDAIVHGADSWQARRVQLDVWQRQADAMRAQLARAVAINTAPVLRRDELRGRLAGFRAKMVGLGRAEDTVLNEMADEAHNELYTAPTELGRAEAILQEFGLALQKATR